MAVNPAFGEHMTAYVRDLNAGGSTVKAAERLIGAVSAEANRDIATYIRKRRPLPVTRLPVVAPASLGHASIRSLSVDEAASSLGELMLRLADREQKARALFEKVLERSPGSVRARVGHAWSLLLAGDRPGAAAGFDALASASGLDAPTRVELARGLFQVAAAESQDSDHPTSANRERFIVARTLFESALDDEANRLEAVNGYVLTCLALEDYPEGLIELAQDAYRVAPRSSVLAVGLALLHELSGEKMAARQYWRDAARSSHTAPMRARVQKALEETSED
jgi:tetratricopeptide (TPR) repeat protein